MNKLFAFALCWMTLVIATFAATSQRINVREHCIRDGGYNASTWEGYLSLLPGDRDYTAVFDGWQFEVNTDKTITGNYAVEVVAGSGFVSTNNSILNIVGPLNCFGARVFDGVSVRGLSSANPEWWVEDGSTYAIDAVNASAPRATKFAGITLGDTTLTSWETGLSTYATTQALEDLNYNFGLSQGNFEILDSYVNDTLVPTVNENFEITKNNFTAGNTLMGQISNIFHQVAEGTVWSLGGAMTNINPEGTIGNNTFVWDWKANEFATDYEEVEKLPSLSLDYRYISNLFVSVDSYAGSNRGLILALDEQFDTIDENFDSVSNVLLGHCLKRALLRLLNIMMISLSVIFKC